MHNVYVVGLSIIWAFLIYILSTTFLQWFLDPDGDFSKVELPKAVRFSFMIASITIVVCLSQTLYHIF